MTIRLFLFIAIFAIACGLARAADYLAGPVEARVIRVIDGDTVKVTAKIWLDQTIEISVRLRGIDTPELKSACSLERALAEKARKRLHVLLHTQDGTPSAITLRRISQGKYGGRVIADVNNGQGISVGDVLLREKIARPYRAQQKKRPWCDTGAEPAALKIFTDIQKPVAPVLAQLVGRKA